MKDANSIVKELQTKVDDAMDSIQAIQGANFRDLLAFVMGCSQTMRLLHAASSTVEDNKLFDVAANQTAQMFSKASALIADAYKIEDQKLDELMKWVETLDGHVYQALREAHQNAKD